MVAREVSRAVRALDCAGRTVLVAVSGGVDSTVLCHALASIAGEHALTLRVGHVHHGLRGPESDADEAAVRALAARLGLPVAVARVAPEALRRGRPSGRRPTLQEAARRVRYDALRRLAAAGGAERIATGHTLDDQAETVVLRLLRGAGPDGLAGIPWRSDDGVVVRPLLGLPRQAIERHAREQGLSWREDRSNRDPRFARGRLRGSGWSDIAAGMNPRWLRAVGDLAEAQRRDAEWIAELVELEADRRFRWERGELCIARDGWPALPEPLALRLARHAWRARGGGRDVSRRHLERMVAFLRRAAPGRRLELPGGLELVAERDGFRLRDAPVRPVPAC